MKYKNLILIGTSHIAKESLREVARVIEKEKPDIVAIELDRRRFYALTQKTKRKPTVKDIKKIVLEKLLSEPEENFDTKFWFGFTDKGCSAWENQYIEFCGEPITWNNAWSAKDSPKEGIGYIDVIGLEKKHYEDLIHLNKLGSIKIATMIYDTIKDDVDYIRRDKLFVPEYKFIKTIPKP